MQGKSRIFFIISAIMFSLICNTPRSEAAWGYILDGSCSITAQGTNNACASPQQICAFWGNFYGACLGATGIETNLWGEFVGYKFNVYYTAWGPERPLGVVARAVCNYGEINSPATASGCVPDHKSELKQLGNPNNASCTAGMAAFEGNPINILTGNKYEEIIDFQSAGEEKIIFTRYYNSLSTYVGTMGLGWTHSFDRKILYDKADGLNASRATVVRPDGAQHIFTRSGSQFISQNKDFDGTLITNGTVWIYTTTDDILEMYDFSSGRLLSARQRSGYTQNLIYRSDGSLSSVVDTFGRKLSFEMKDGVIQSMTDPDGRSYSYAYDAPVIDVVKRLLHVTYPGSAAPRVQYVYDIPGYPFALGGIVDEAGARLATWRYDEKMRANFSEHAGGTNTTRVTYNISSVGSGTVAVTTALGGVTTYTVRSIQGVPKVVSISRPATGSAPATTETIAYDTNGYVAKWTNGRGIATTYANDSRGKPTVITEAAGTTIARTTTITYHETFRIPTKVVAPGITTLFDYDASGRLQSKTEIDTTTITVPYPTNGKQRSWTYGWENSLLTSITGPRSDLVQTTKLEYDATGAVTSIINAKGHRTRVTKHTASGLPQTIVDPNGVITDLTYDDRQRLISRTVTGGSELFTTSLRYDEVGNPRTIVRPDGSTFTGAYDPARRLISITDEANVKIQFTLDALDNATRTEFTNTKQAGKTRIMTSAFDAFSRLAEKSGAAGQTTTLSYDGNGNSIAEVNPLGRVTRREFDALDRAIRTIDAEAGITSMTYDAQDNLTSVADPNGVITRYTYDGFRNMIQETSADAGTTIYQRDLADNVVQRVDARGVTTSFAYDALDRLTKIYTPGNPVETVTRIYDEPGHGFGIGRLTTMTDRVGTLSLSYDARANVVYEARAQGQAAVATAYAYDTNNRLRAITYPSGLMVAYDRDRSGQITGMLARRPNADQATALISAITYHPAGPLRSLIYGNGVAEVRDVDGDHRLVAMTSAGIGSVQQLAYGYDAASNVSMIYDGIRTRASQAFSYDKLNRLVSAAGLYGTLLWTYDGASNRTAQIASRDTGTTSTQYGYASGTNRLTSISTGTTNQTIGHTAAGNIESITSPNGETSNFSYDQTNRLTQAWTNGRLTANYLYDGFGSRSEKHLPDANGTVIIFFHDSNYHLLGEANAAGRPTLEYVYLDDMLVATFNPISGRFSFVHTDRLGTPRMMLDEQQMLIWASDYQPFGEASVGVSSAAQNVRFPGQYFDTESNLHHNGFRDYIPCAGRYLQADPIGLTGGINRYIYVAGNPLRQVDPSGLATCEAPFENGIFSCQPWNPDNAPVSFKFASGNNGGGENCRNKASCTSKENHGPIPTGCWKWTNGSTTKENGRRLTPCADTGTNGLEKRTDILSHSCAHPFGPGRGPKYCSKGCITGTAEDMKKLNKLIDAEPGSVLLIRDKIDM